MGVSYVIYLLVAVLAVEYLGGYLIKAIYKKRLQNSTSGKLVLTYDDGPGNLLEGRLLELLEREQVKATFFLHSDRVRQFETGARRLKTSGHEIAVHTSTHLNPWKSPPWRLLLDVIAARHELKDCATNRNLYRPPFGKLTTSTWLYLVWKKIQIAFWTIDSGDTWDEIPESRQIVRKLEANGGGVILLHSHDREFDDAEAVGQYVLDTTLDLIEYARKNNIGICCFSDLR